MSKPEAPLNLACAWCKGGPATPVGEPYWDDGKGDGATHGGCWYQVYEHEGCDSSVRGTDHNPGLKQWTYRIAYRPKPDSTPEADK